MTFLFSILKLNEKIPKKIKIKEGVKRKHKRKAAGRRKARNEHSEQSRGLGIQGLHGGPRSCHHLPRWNFFRQRLSWPRLALRPIGLPHTFDLFSFLDTCSYGVIPRAFCIMIDCPVKLMYDVLSIVIGFSFIKFQKHQFWIIDWFYTVILRREWREVYFKNWYFPFVLNLRNLFEKSWFTVCLWLGRVDSSSLKVEPQEAAVGE